MIDNTLNNIVCFNNLKDYFFVINRDFSIDGQFLMFGEERLSLKNFDLREVIYNNNKAIIDELEAGTLSSFKLFRILKVYEYKSYYLEMESQFYKELGTESDNIKRFHSYLFQLKLYEAYLTPELKKLLDTYAKRLMFLAVNNEEKDNPRITNEEDFWNSTLAKVSEINDKEVNGKQKVKGLKLVNHNADGSVYDDEDDYPDYSIEYYRSQSKAGYLNVFLNVLFLLSIGILLGSLLFIKAIA